jgi:hypothetical protein
LRNFIRVWIEIKDLKFFTDNQRRYFWKTVNVFCCLKLI